MDLSTGANAGLIVRLALLAWRVRLVQLVTAMGREESGRVVFRLATRTRTSPAETPL
jgi:hypothetical protein